MGLTWGDFKWGEAYWNGEYLPNMVVDRTKSDVDNNTSKAFYNADDFNRVETAVEYISKLLTDSGYFTTVTVKKDWTKSDIPSAKDMERFISNINKCVNNFTSAGYPIPSTLVGINFESANNIEKTLEGLQILVDNMKAAYRYVGTFYAGQMDGLRGYCL